MFSPAGTRRCRPGRFRFIPPHMCCQAYIPDCHLVRTAIPRLPSYDSLGDFHSRENRSLSLFCKHGFQKRCRHPLWPQRTAAWSSFPTCSLKAGYAARSNTILCTALQVLILARTRAGPHGRFCPSSHNTRSPRKTGRMPHAIGARPESLTPSIHPKLGVKSRHQGLHRCALQRIFRPFLENGLSD